MFEIGKELVEQTLRLVVDEKDFRGNIDWFALCLHNGTIEDRDDLVYFNSRCRGDYLSRKQVIYDSNVFNRSRIWYDQTQPMSKDGAIWIIEDWFDGNDYCEDFFVSLQLSILSKDIDEVLIGISSSDDYHTLNDVESICVTLWENDCLKEQLRTIHTDYEIATDDDLWQKYKGKLFEYSINLKGVVNRAAIIASIKRTGDHFVLNRMSDFFSDILSCVNNF